MSNYVLKCSDQYCFAQRRKKMVLKGLALIFCGVLLLEETSCRETWSCTPSKPNSLVWIPTHEHPINISSPTTFPSNSSVNCSWKIETPRGYRIRVHFNFLNLKNSVNCSQGSVEVREKRGLVSILLGRYCGVNTPVDVVTESSFVSLIYRLPSNASYQGHPGFHVTIALTPTETCSVLNNPEANNNIALSGSSGSLITPVFPLEYPINIKCRWTITVPIGHRIKLTFHAFRLGSTPQNGDCSDEDFVEVRDSYSRDDPSYGTFCGSLVPSPIHSVGPKMVVTFKSDEKTVFQGFFARFDAIPEGVCTHNNSIVQKNLAHNSTGRVSSPDYPLHFPPISACYWRLKAPDGYRVKLHFTTVNIMGSCQGNVNTEGEWVRVDDSFTADFKSVASFWGGFCGNVSSPPVIYSTQSELQVFLTSNYSTDAGSKGAMQSESSHTNHGFYATYEVIPQGYTSRCRTDSNPEEPIKVQGNTGTLVSPGYPYSYPVIVCKWNIDVQKGNIVEVNFHDFEIDCAGGSTLKIGDDEKEFCGSNKPDNVLTSETDLKLKLVIKEGRNNRGFRASFSIREKEPEVASIVPWIVIPLVLLAVGVTLCVAWRRRSGGRDRGSSFKSSIINRMRTQSTASQ